MKRKYLHLTIIVTAFLALFVPISTTEIPEWRIEIVDEAGERLPNIPVRQNWAFGGLPEESNETLLTDGDGVVVFPERRLSSSIALRIFGKILDKANDAFMPHGAARGTRAFIFSPAGAYNWLEYRKGQALPKTLVVKKLL